MFILWLRTINKYYFTLYTGLFTLSMQWNLQPEFGNLLWNFKIPKFEYIKLLKVKMGMSMLGKSLCILNNNLSGYFNQTLSSYPSNSVTRDSLLSHDHFLLFLL